MLILSEMLIYPDARDLINLFKEIPVSAADLKRVLEATKSQLVLSFENVSEIVVIDDPPETRRRLRLLETLPVRYMLALPQLRCLELANAAKAYDSDKAVLSIDPFVPYWEEAFGLPHENVLTYSLTDVIMELLHKNPNQFRKTQTETD